MAAEPFDSYFLELARKYSILGEPENNNSIGASLDGLMKNLSKEFGHGRVEKCEVFGSFDRCTILNSKVYPANSIDVLVVFAKGAKRCEPHHYRVLLRNFALKYYWKTHMKNVRWHPSYVAILLDNVWYRLVPGQYEKKFWQSFPRTLIPGPKCWKYTMPMHSKKKLWKKNWDSGHILLPIVTLLKAWNVSCGFPYSPFLLERKIVGMDLLGHGLQSGLFYAVGQLKPNYFQRNHKKSKLKELRHNMGNAKIALEFAEIENAKMFFHLVFPKI